MSLNQFPRRAFSGAATLQTFTGNGSSTAFTLTQAQYQNESFVFVDDVAQVPGVDFTINATTLTFTSAPANSSEIIVRGFGVPTPLNDVSDASITSAKLATGAIEAKLGYTPVSPTQLNNLIDNAPTALDTLNELSAALGDDANYATTITNALSTKASTTYVNDQIAAIQVTPTQVSDKNNTSTGYFKLPVGTTAQRPATPTTGMVRMNSTTGYPEWFDNLSSSWVEFNKGLPYSIELLVVAGGGGGGLHSGGGGGAGGLIYYGSETPKTPNGSAITILGGTSYSVVIGGGGAGSGGPYQSVTGNGYDGQNSSFSSYVAIGGGGGGSGGNSAIPGRPGGSGGGGGRNAPGGSGTSGQGNSGGYWGVTNPNYPGGGGGGAGGVGTGGDSGVGGSGGVGLYYSAFTHMGSPAGWFAGGGGGNLQDSSDSVPPQGAGGNGGGANGRNTGGVATSGVANTGGGGGANNYNTSGGGPGGSGVVILRYAGAQRGTGGTVTSSGGYTIHTFTSSGTYTA